MLPKVLSENCSVRLYFALYFQVNSFFVNKILSVTCGRSVVSLVTPVSSINKTDCHNITVILMKAVLNTKTEIKNKNIKVKWSSPKVTYSLVHSTKCIYFTTNLF